MMPDIRSLEDAARVAMAGYPDGEATPHAGRLIVRLSLLFGRLLRL